MHISLKNIGRRFNKEWIFKGLDYSFESGNSYAVLGPNGSGKSTLLSILMASLSPSEGTITYRDSDKEIMAEQVFNQISFAGPYLDLIEEFTLAETIAFHFNFKNYVEGLSAEGVLDLLALAGAKNKPLKYFSSGMKQRTKLALAFCSDTPVLVLDEPTSNLDTQGTDWYLSLVEKLTANKLVVLGSNQQHEYDFCKEQIHIMSYKLKEKTP